MSEHFEETLSLSGFEILTKLSSGGMGDVLLARRRGVHGFEKLVAIKTIRGDLAKRPDIRAMFLDEARLSARLDHPTIAQVYDFGEQGGTLFLAMEYVPGIALNRLLAKRGGPVPPGVAMRIVGEVCRGLHAAHELLSLDGRSLGVVHRDVSPGNLILTFDGHMKILDFGIAFMRGRESPDTVVGELKGKPSYMAPEHLRGEGVDRRADIYSVSVVLHELLTGRKLFTRDTVVATVLAVETSRVPPPSTLVPGTLPPGLDAIVLRGLERDPSDRFPDARSMAAALDRLLVETNAEPLEAFVETELGRDREAHRRWLQSVLSGNDRGEDTAEGFAETFPATPSAKAESAPRPVPAAGEQSSRSGSHVHPLADSTTIIPAGVDPSEEEARASAGRILRSAITLSVIAAISFGGAFVAYRSLFVSDVQPFPIAEPRLEALPSDLGVGGSTEAAARSDDGNAAPRPPPASSTTAVTGSAPDPSELVPAIEPEAPAVDEGDGATPETAERMEPQPNKKEARKSRPQVSKKKAPAADRAGPLSGRETSPAEPATFGFVTVGAQPYALVRIDGEDVGVTPIMRRKLSAGVHEIELVRPDTGEVRLKRTVTLAEGDHQRITIP